MSTQTLALGEYVRTCRENQGLSQRALAARAGVDPSWLSRLERGERKANRSDSERTLILLAQALGQDPGPLLRLAGHVTAGHASEGMAKFRDVVLADPALLDPQKKILLDIYESWVPPHVR